jgi:putative spermidine/putrescine transport system substrate-binding protein
MMHVDSANPNCAYMWMEHSLASNLQGDLAAWFGANPSGAGCLHQGQCGMSDRRRLRWTNGFDNFEKVKFWTTPTSKCASAERSACPTTAGCPTISA